MADTARAAVMAPAKAEADFSDECLLRQCRQGDEDAATRLYTRYVNRLRALAEARCSRALARRVDPDDIVQSAFRSFFRGVRQGFYDVPEGEDLWKLLLVIVLNKIRAKGAFHRAAKRDVRLTESVDWSQSAPDDHPGSGDFDKVFLRMVIQEALEQLDPRQREMVELRIQGHEVAEIATITGRSKRTVERILQEVRERLRVLLSQDQ